MTGQSHEVEKQMISNHS